ncbi:hypothetical protein RGQ29_029530 [Quercus rubra]|uniref:TF-B3 domain-containing protein n=1 Tax=Quercus rubra TaxID=3512 RepID=A0AAN7EF37_QUERU|nr:hypothetical protein RGQ29_029530 [Quercus rubra]
MKPYSCKPPDFPPFPRLNSLIGACSKPFEKQLAFSYVRGDQSKLSLNKLDNEDVDNGIPIVMYDIKGKEHSMTFKHWESRVYILKEGWNTFCQKHSLREHKDFVTMWMFRHVQTMLFHLFEKTNVRRELY